MERFRETANSSKSSRLPQIVFHKCSSRTCEQMGMERGRLANLMLLPVPNVSNFCTLPSDDSRTFFASCFAGELPSQVEPILPRRLICDVRFGKGRAQQDTHCYCDIPHCGTFMHYLLWSRWPEVQTAWLDLSDLLVSPLNDS